MLNVEHFWNRTRNFLQKAFKLVLLVVLGIVALYILFILVLQIYLQFSLKKIELNIAGSKLFLKPSIVVFSPFNNIILYNVKLESELGSGNIRFVQLQVDIHKFLTRKIPLGTLELVNGELYLYEKGYSEILNEVENLQKGGGINIEEVKKGILNNIRTQIRDALLELRRSTIKIKNVKIYLLQYAFIEILDSLLDTYSYLATFNGDIRLKTDYKNFHTSIGNLNIFGVIQPLKDTWLRLELKISDIDIQKALLEDMYLYISATREQVTIIDKPSKGKGVYLVFENGILSGQLDINLKNLISLPITNAQISSAKANIYYNYFENTANIKIYLYPFLANLEITADPQKLSAFIKTPYPISGNTYIEFLHIPNGKLQLAKANIKLENIKVAQILGAIPLTTYADISLNNSSNNVYSYKGTLKILKYGNLYINNLKMLIINSNDWWWYVSTTNFSTPYNNLIKITGTIFEGVRFYAELSKTFLRNTLKNDLFPKDDIIITGILNKEKQFKGSIKYKELVKDLNIEIDKTYIINVISFSPIPDLVIRGQINVQDTKNIYGNINVKYKDILENEKFNIKASISENQFLSAVSEKIYILLYNLNHQWNLKIDMKDLKFLKTPTTLFLNAKIETTLSPQLPIKANLVMFDKEKNVKIESLMEGTKDLIKMEQVNVYYYDKVLKGEGKIENIAGEPSINLNFPLLGAISLKISQGNISLDSSGYFFFYDILPKIKQISGIYDVLKNAKGRYVISTTYDILNQNIKRSTINLRIVEEKGFSSSIEARQLGNNYYLAFSYEKTGGYSINGNATVNLQKFITKEKKKLDILNSVKLGFDIKDKNKSVFSFYTSLSPSQPSDEEIQRLEGFVKIYNRFIMPFSDWEDKITLSYLKGFKDILLAIRRTRIDTGINLDYSFNTGETSLSYLIDKKEIIKLLGIFNIKTMELALSVVGRTDISLIYVPGFIDKIRGFTINNLKITGKLPDINISGDIKFDSVEVKWYFSPYWSNVDKAELMIDNNLIKYFYLRGVSKDCVYEMVGKARIEKFSLKDIELFIRTLSGIFPAGIPDGNIRFFGGVMGKIKFFGSSEDLHISGEMSVAENSEIVLVLTASPLPSDVKYITQIATYDPLIINIPRGTKIYTTEPLFKLSTADASKLTLTGCFDKGTLNVKGVVRFNDGEISYFGAPFKLTELSLIFEGFGYIPKVNGKAETTATYTNPNTGVKENVNIYLLISGSLDSFDKTQLFRLQSDPPLPPSEILKILGIEKTISRFVESGLKYLEAIGMSSFVALNLQQMLKLDVFQIHSSFIEKYLEKREFPTNWQDIFYGMEISFGKFITPELLLKYNLYFGNSAFTFPLQPLVGISLEWNLGLLNISLSYLPNIYLQQVQYYQKFSIYMQWELSR